MGSYPSLSGESEPDLCPVSIATVEALESIWKGPLSTLPHPIYGRLITTKKERANKRGNFMLCPSLSIPESEDNILDYITLG